MDPLIGKCAHYAAAFYSPGRRRKLAEEICEGKPQWLPCDLLRAVRDRCGLGQLLLADLVLFGWCFLVCLLADLLLPARVLLKNSLGFLCCFGAFCLWGDQEKRLLLKLGFLCFALLDNGSWTLTAVFLLLFEHMSRMFKDGEGGLRQ